FPELTHSMLDVLYPHYLRPFPSMAIVQFEPDITNIQPTGLVIPRHARLHSERIGRISCQFRSCYDVQLWPLQIASAAWQLAPFDAALSPPPNCAAILRLRIHAQNGVRLSDLPLDFLRLHINGEVPKISQLYELLLNHTLRMEFRQLDSNSPTPPIVCDPRSAITPVGFAPEEELLPYSEQTFAGYRTLGEFFNFPEKFAFIDLKGWDQVRAAGFGTRAEVVFYLDRDATGLDQEVDAQTFRLGCTPIANLFEKVAEPIRLTHRQYEYRVIPDVQRQKDMEVYSVQRVISAAPGATREFRPFYDFRRYGDRASERDRSAFWCSMRRPSQTSEEVTTDMFLQFVDEHYDPHLPSDAVVIATTLCTNGDLPYRLQQSGHPLVFNLEMASPIKRVTTLCTPTPTLRPPLGRHVHWRLIEHLSSHHWSFSDNEHSLSALQELLRLYCLADDTQHPQAASLNEQLIDSLLSLTTRRALGRVGGPTDGDFVRGLETTIEFDEDKCRGVSVLLFASVIERFLSASVSINSFHQLVAKAKQGQRTVRRWQPRAGEVRLT
ncbi:MAG TPA: type VI secretion system baseplate subunit TssF, partial [Pirellulaceae bacterium]|nr:type VI secretion system baseplate subunit TssF [Pirellulaceae bacterium]